MFNDPLTIRFLEGVATAFPLESYLAFADARNDQGGEVSISRPRRIDSKAEPNTGVAVFDGEPETQRLVSLTLADFLALVIGRSQDVGVLQAEDFDHSANHANSRSLRARGEAALAKALHPSITSGEFSDTSAASEALYGCQISLAGAGAPEAPSALRECLAAGVLALLPEWAHQARAAAAEAIHFSTAAIPAATVSAAVQTVAPVDSFAHAEMNGNSSSLGGFAMGSDDGAPRPPAATSINAWLCVGRHDGSSSAPEFQTEAHYDGCRGMSLRSSSLYSWIENACVLFRLRLQRQRASTKK